MRLGQLARKLDIKKSEIQKIVKEQFNVELGDHPNVKVDDSHVDFISEQFKAEETKPEVIEQKVIQKEESKVEEKKVVVEKPKAGVEQTKVVIDQLEPTMEVNIPTDVIEVRSEDVVVPTNLENVQHIETQKADGLSGPKILGKIEVPELAPDLVEVDGVMVDRTELKAQEKEIKRLEYEAKLKVRETAKLKREAQNDALLSGESIASEKERKAAEKLIEEQRQRQLEYEKKKKKERYDKIKEANKASAPLNKKQKKKKKVQQIVEKEVEVQQEIEQKVAVEPKGSVFKQLWRWLTTE